LLEVPIPVLWSLPGLAQHIWALDGRSFGSHFGGRSVMAGSVGGPVEGPLGPFVDGFVAYLIEQGHSHRSVLGHVRRVRHMSRWMTAERIGVAQLTPTTVERFLADRRREGEAVMISPRGSRPLLEYLAGLGVLPAEDRVRSSAEVLLEGFRVYLLDERGLQASTAAHYESAARLFLAERSEPLGDALARLSAAEITAFVLDRSRRGSVTTASTAVCALRALLAFLHLRGDTPRSLVSVVPSVARRTRLLPRGLDVAQVALLFESCDRDSVVGRRDLAVLKLLARLGLRAGEVARLQLDDVDWRAGEIVVVGKGPRLERMPVPNDVGEAIVAYLRDRPRVCCRALFLRSKAPLVGLTSAGVTGIVVRAGARVGLVPIGAHRLRHTAATELLRAGASLPDIGQVLRHRRLGSTTVYARVDRERLKLLALPWPEVNS
jgi:site-specific recombinase XerD